MELVLSVPRRFSFRGTVLSHGWALLPPFELERRDWVLRRVLTLPGRRPVVVAYREVARGLRVEAEPARMSARSVAALARQTSLIFGLGVDLEPFYRATSRHAELRWFGRAGAGRLLRGPTVFEDLVKLILTTNCSWGSTVRMVRELVGLGEADPGGRRAFPTPAAVAGAGVEYLDKQVRAGYRSASILALAKSVAAGEVDLESWLELPRSEVRRRALALRGVGPYVADNLLGLLGLGRGLGLDSWVRWVMAQREGRALADDEIGLRYAHLGEHAGLALWCDLSRDWLQSPDGNVGALTAAR